jgi:hypothetical protein
MPGIARAALIAAVIVIVLVRQFRPQKITEDARRWWVLPVVLGFLALREPGLIDHDHRLAAAALLAVEILVGVATGAAWGWTSRVWVDGSGAVWIQGAKTTAAVWAGAVVCRARCDGVEATRRVRAEHPGTQVWCSPPTPTTTRSSPRCGPVPAAGSGLFIT